MIKWGISANSHDAALAVLKNNEIVFASHAERFSGVKNDAHLNFSIVNYAREFGEPDSVCWYEKPIQKSIRQLTAGQGFRFRENNVKQYLSRFDITAPVSYKQHHKSHAAAGYYTSPFNDAVIVCIDAIGEWQTLSIWEGRENELTEIFSQSYPHSVGLWYSAMTQRIGLTPNEDEYILMGMAAYGDPIRLRADVKQDFFKTFPSRDWPATRLKHNLHQGCAWWRPDLQSEQDLFDIAAATQSVYEEFFERLLESVRHFVPHRNLVLTGGCALNCAANSQAYRYFDSVWIMPNPGDAGNALGAVLDDFTEWKGPYLGYDIAGEYPVEKLIHELANVGIVGVANGKAEYGPRALGNRSLLADPRGKAIKDQVNRIKQRQKFRPFAPAILEEHADKYFAGITGPYMQYTAVCRYPNQFPAIVHKDGTSRVQTVSKQDNPGFRQLLGTWYEQTGCPMLLNTSLNIKGKPIVNTKQDARDFEIHYGVRVW
jgi:carbamoyltransferase